MTSEPVEFSTETDDTNRRHGKDVAGAMTRSASSSDSTGARNLDAIIERSIAEGRIVGGVVMVNRDGARIYERAAGYADREDNRSVDVDTPFRYASLTKPFTTMSALKLAEAGRLNPDAPVSDYLPEFRLTMMDGSVADPALSLLMAHLAGLDYRFQQPEGGSYARAGISDGLDRSVVSLAENLRRIASVPLDIVPGSAWRYSVSTDVVGAVIEKITGVELDEAIRNLVTGPLGLNVRLHWDGDELAKAYRDSDGGAVPMKDNDNVPLPLFEGPGVSFDINRIHDRGAWPSGGAGAAGRAGDMLTLLEAFRGGDFLSETWRREARKPRIGAEAQTQGPGWGYSWLGSVLIDPTAADSRWSQGSVAWGGVYGASWGIDFERRLSFVSLTNTTLEGMFGKFAQDVATAVTELES
ncbi:serine hydrolase domain-containing protein [Paracoccus aerodenitrificans]|uniref:serine hydrolase domain-containing protein n=1 Tax=Paracoccus aerodenitrificans TaxID=3017781 RepID=UPI0022F11667|nr:serine hydrolase domain-containing protein [Paracoccus aerodenitrificans]WBU64294.1 serine hydrolase [Paracoccus aerodenitrificans]